MELTILLAAPMESSSLIHSPIGACLQPRSFSPPMASSCAGMSHALLIKSAKVRRQGNIPNNKISVGMSVAINDTPTADMTKPTSCL